MRGAVDQQQPMFIAFTLEDRVPEDHPLRPIKRMCDRIVAEGLAEHVIHDDHFTVDGTLIRSLAGHKSVKPIDQDDDEHDPNGWSSFKGGKRSNTTHRSVVDPDALPASRGGEAHLSHSMHLLTDSRTGLCVNIAVDTDDDRAQRRNALLLPDRVKQRLRISPKVLAADKNHSSGEFLCELESRWIMAHAAIPKVKIRGDSESHRAEACETEDAVECIQGKSEDAQVYRAGDRLDETCRRAESDAVHWLRAHPE